MNASPSTTTATRAQEGSRLVLLGVFANIVLSFAKLFGGILGHSSALLADAVESMLDIFNSLIMWVAIKLGGTPADERHPFGHGKIESLAAVLGSLMLLFAGIFIAWEAGSGLFAPDAHQPPAPFTFFIVLAVVIIKETLYRIFVRKAQEIESSALLTDAWHHRSDAITSIAALLGIGVAVLTGWIAADKIAALLCCAIIFFNGYNMLRHSLGEVLDEQMPADFLLAVREEIAQVAGVLEVEKCRIRKSGLSRIADIHIHVAPEISVAEGHAIAHAVKDHLRHLEKSISDVTIHVEPHTA